MDQNPNSDANQLDTSSQSNRASTDANKQGASSASDAKHETLADVVNAAASSASKGKSQDSQVQSLNKTGEAGKPKKVEAKVEPASTVNGQGKDKDGQQDGQSKTTKEKVLDENGKEVLADEGEDVANLPQETEAEATERERLEQEEKDKTSPPPFHEHPRWKEKVAEVEQLKPLAEQANQLNTWAKEYSVTDTEFQDTLMIVQLLKTDPTKAYEKLVPIMDSLKPFIGEKLPKDLQDYVDANKLDPELAKQIAKERMSSTFQRQNQERVQTQRAQQEIVNEMNKWEGSKKTDPDAPFIMEQVKDRFLRLASTNKISDTKSAVALCERAFTEIKAERKRLIPTPPRRRPFIKSGSSSNAKVEAQTLKDVVFQTAGVAQP